MYVRYTRSLARRVLLSSISRCSAPDPGPLQLVTIVGGQAKNPGILVRFG